MPWTEPLTHDDLDEVGGSAFGADDSLAVAAELVDAVERGWVADKADLGYALTLAAEIVERAGDLHSALELAERGVGAYRRYGDARHGYPRAFRAELLLRSGREDEAMAELAGRTRLALLAGSADELAGYATRVGGDPTDPDVRQGYAEHLESHPRETRWPPGRNEACWCGSGLKYKKCCLPRARA